MIPYGKQQIDANDIASVVQVLQSDYLTTGPKIAEFENELCKITKSSYAIAVCNGTAALHLSALCLFDVGDEILVSPNTFLASANAIIYANAKPVFCDIDNNGNMDLDLARTLCEQNPNIKGIVAVHFSGNALDFAKLQSLKNDFNLKIIEDGAHSLGMAGLGSVGDCTILSFHPVKHITTGEGGAILTNDKLVANKLKTMRSHGMTKESFENLDLAYDKNGLLNPWYYEMTMLGFNYRITDIACALGISQLAKLEYFLDRRKELAKRYESLLCDISNIALLYSYNDISAYHLFVVLVDFDAINKTKAELFNAASKAGILLQTHYIPVNAQPFYKHLGYSYQDTPKAFEYYQKAISLPLYPALTNEEQDMVVRFLLDFAIA